METQCEVISVKKVARDMGKSYSCLRLWAKRGWLPWINICGKPYVTVRDLVAFRERAERGEFARVRPVNLPHVRQNQGAVA